MGENSVLGGGGMGPADVVRYPMSTAYNAGYNPFCNCGQNYGCCGMAA